LCPRSQSMSGRNASTGLNRSSQTYGSVLRSTQTTVSAADVLAVALNTILLWSEPIISGTNGDVIVKNSLRTAALSFGIAALLGSVAVGFAQTSSTTSSSETTTQAPPPVAVYPAPVIVAPPPIVVAAPAPAPAPVVVEPSTTSEHHSASSSSNSSPSGDSSEHTSSSSTRNY
jgi:hypothetical protein